MFEFGYGIFYFNTMISTKNLIARLEDVPKEWVFEFYLKLSEKLTGQSVKIKSILHNFKLFKFLLYFLINFIITTFK